MPARLARGVITPKNQYICPLCRPRISLAQAQKSYQHTGPPANVGGNTSQEVVPKDMGGHATSTSQSSIADIVRSFMFKPDEKDKESKGDSKYGSHEPPRRAPKDMHSIKSQAKPGTDVVQQKLQEKFAAQRRKDMLAMGASQGIRGAEGTKKVSKALRVPESVKQSPKKRSLRATRLEKRERKLQKAAIAKEAIKQKALEQNATKQKAIEQEAIEQEAIEQEAIEQKAIEQKAIEQKAIEQKAIEQKAIEQKAIKKRAIEERIKRRATKQVKQAQAKLIDLAHNEVERIATSMEPHAATQLPTDIQASGVEDRKADDNDSTRKASSKRRAISHKLNDIMNTLDTSKDAKKPRNSEELAKRAGEMGTRSTDLELQRVVTAVLKELQNRGESLDKDHRTATALRMSTYQDTSRSSKLQILPKRASRKHPAVRRVGSDGPLPYVRKYRARPRVRSIVVKESKQYPEGLKSLRAALLKGQNDKARSRTTSPSKTAKKPRASPLKTPLGKTRKSKRSITSRIEMSTASSLELTPVKVEQPPVPRLAYGLERVLFNPGVYQLQDPRSRVYNFDPYLQKIMPIEEFDFNALREYITSSRDESLNDIAKEHGKRYMGSTSSMTAVLAHFHYLLSQWRPINTSMLSKAFPASLDTFTEIQRIPSAIILRWKNGSYAIDADKEFASANVLSMLGRSMEKLLTLSMNDFERYRKSNPGQVTKIERFAPESYHYSTLGDFLMRSQLDSHDPRLPGTGMFDLKTRSVVSIRMDVSHYEHGIGYEIMNPQGEWESYEREYYDMIRSAFLKYSLQVRMGRMDGIFVAFHNIERIFGFQYISLPEMDCTIHGQRDTSIGDQEFRLSLDLMNKILDRATKKFPDTSLRIHFETRQASTNFMYIFAEPVTEEQVAEIQSQKDAEIQEFERNVRGLTRGNDSDTGVAPEIDPKWEKIQSDVQKVMDEDELFKDGPGDNEGIEGTESNSKRPEVSEQGPLYTRKSASGAGNPADAVSVGYEEAECENEEEEEDEENKDDGNGNGDGDAEESRRQEGPDEFLNDKAKIDTTDTFEAEQNVDGNGTEQNNVALSEDYAVKAQSVITSTQGEDQQEQQTHTGQPLPDSVNEEVVQENTAATSSGSKDVLAMTLTLRNKVNGKYVQRPKRMSAADDWSVEYSLRDVSGQKRARSLYQACQVRRRKKMESTLVSDSDEERVVSGYIHHLRSLSQKGRNWRKEQDKMDQERPMQVLSEKEGPGAARKKEAEK